MRFKKGPQPLVSQGSISCKIKEKWYEMLEFSYPERIIVLRSLKFNAKAQ